MGGGASAAVDCLHLARAALRQIGKGASEAVHTPSSRFNGSVSLASVDQEIECGNLFVLVTFLFGLAVGGAFTYCCCVPRETAVISDALRFFVMKMNGDVEDASFCVRLLCMDRFCPLWIQQRSQSSRGCWWCKAMP